VATEDELKRARAAHAKNEFGDDRAAWYPNWLRVTPEIEAARKGLMASVTSESFEGWASEEELTANAELFAIYGRVMAKRGPFLVIQTPYGRIQVYFAKEVQKAGLKGTLKRTDVGDHVWARGRKIKTLKGDKALACPSPEDFRHVAKAMLPPPEKWHGLKDVEKRYRERYVDLFANPEVASVFRARSRIVKTCRSYLDERDFLEVETPMLQSVRGGATAKPFSTHHNALDIGLYLRIAPELYLKRLVVGGFDRVYEIGRNFRNEGISTRHNPEFTMLEYYVAYATYEDQMDLVEGIFSAADDAVRAEFPALTTERTFSLEHGFQRVPMRRAILDAITKLPQSPWHGAFDEEALYRDADALAAACEAVLPKLRGTEQKALAKCETNGERVYTLFELVAEEHLEELYRTPDRSKSMPVFITDFPFEVSPLSRRNDEDPAFVDRFELFLEGRELANGFSELNDPDDQASRFNDQLVAREKGEDEAMDFDADYIRALSHGMPNAAGCGIGIDRMVMALVGQSSIRDVLLFPLLRPEDVVT